MICLRFNLSQKSCYLLILSDQTNSPGYRVSLLNAICWTSTRSIWESRGWWGVTCGLLAQCTVTTTTCWRWRHNCQKAAVWGEGEIAKRWIYLIRVSLRLFSCHVFMFFTSYDPQSPDHLDRDDQEEIFLGCDLALVNFTSLNIHSKRLNIGLFKKYKGQTICAVPEWVDTMCTHNRNLTSFLLLKKSDTGLGMFGAAETVVHLGANSLKLGRDESINPESRNLLYKLENK